MPDDQASSTDIERALRVLKTRDSKLSEIIDQVGYCHLESRAQGLTPLIYSVIGQQLSKSSAGAIRLRFDALFDNGGIDPNRLVEMSEEELRKTGLSLTKTRCLRSLAEYVLSNKIDFTKLEVIDDEAVINTLTQVKGIGRWTAEMYLMFSLRRLDVFPIDDLTIRSAMRDIYSLPKDGFFTLAKQTADRWRPYRTIACCYLYRYVDMLRDNGKQ